MFCGQQCCEVAFDRQLGLAVSGEADADAGDQLAKRFADFAAAVLVGRCPGEAVHQARIFIMTGRQDRDHLRRSRCDLPRQACLVGGQGIEPVAYLVIAAAVDDGIDAALDLSLYPGEVGRQAPVPLALSRVALGLRAAPFGGGLLQGFRLTQQPLDGGEGARFQLGGGQRTLLRAGAALPVMAAAIAPGGDHGHRPAAAGAAEQAGQRAGRPPAGGAGLLCQLALRRLRRRPLLRRQDRQLRRLPDDPHLRRVLAHALPARRRIGDFAAPVPDRAAHIHLVVQDAVAMLALAVDRRGLPDGAARAGYAARVEIRGERARRGAGRIAIMHLADDGRFSRVDLELAASGNAVAIGPPAGRGAIADTGSEAAPRLGAQLREEHRVHDALEADMQGRHVLFGNRHDAHFGEGQRPVDEGRIGLVAAETVKRLGHHHIAAAARRINHHCLKARPGGHAGATDRLVGILGHDLPAPAGRLAAQEVELVGHRSGCLKVGRIAGVEGGAGHGAGDCRLWL